MQVVSINVGEPRETEWRGERRRSGIWKRPVEGRVTLRPLNFDGDGQADLRVHGGVSRAAYLYPAEHYAAWKQELPELEFPFGAFGENLTVSGLREDEVRIGDRLKIGEAELWVAQPRHPCSNLAMRFDRDDMIARFRESRRLGFYLGVLREGSIGAGDRVEFTHRAVDSFTILEISALYLSPHPDPEAARRAAALEALSADWRRRFSKVAEED